MDSTHAAASNSPARHSSAFSGSATSLAPQQRGAFPIDAVEWLVGGHDQFVVSLAQRHPASDATTTGLHLAGHRVVATTGPLPFPHGSADAVVAAGALPDLEAAARVLRPDGRLSLVCHQRDHRIPWARRFDALLGLDAADDDPAVDLEVSRRFGFVEEARFRYWQRLDAAALADLVRVEAAERDEAERDRLVAAALALHEEYSRGPDGLRMPWLSHCYRARLVDAPPPPAPEPPPAPPAPEELPGFAFHAADGDRGGAAVLIDLR